MDSGTISAGSVVWNLDVNQAELEAGLVAAQQKVETYAALVESTNKSMAASAATVAGTQESSATRVAEASALEKDAIVANDDEVISRNALTIASFNSVGASLEKNAGVSKSLGIGAAAIAAGIGISVGAMVKAAGDFQASMTRLVTSAGESDRNLQLVSNGVLQVARDTGTATTQLASAMYIIESGGQHGAAGLTVLKAAAQGAKTENADLATVADAVTSAMTDYHFAASQAADVTSKLVAATGQGKTTFQDLAAAMPAILPTASAAHISLNEVLGDLASMTIHGMSADQAAQNLAHSIRSLQSPTQAMSKELAALGLNSTEVAQQLGSKGLYGSLQQISDAITSQMGKGSTAVILNMQNALKGLPQAVQDVSQQVINGTATWTDWNKATKNLTVTQHAQAGAFATLFNGMHTIGTEQMSGAQVMQTYAGAMQKAVGTSDGLNVALMLTGQNSQNTTNAIKAVSDSTAEAGGNVKGWGDIQRNFNQQMSVLRENLTTTGIAIGTALLPPLTSFARAIGSILTPAATFISRNKTLVAGFLLVTGALATLVAMTWVTSVAWTTLGTTFTKVGNMPKALTEAIVGLRTSLATAAAFITETAIPTLVGSFTTLWTVIGGGSLALDAVNPIFAIITAIALLAVGIYEVVDHWKAVKNWVVKFWNDWKLVIIEFTLFFAPEVLIIAGLADIVVRHWTPIKQFFTQLWDDITHATEIFVNGITSRVDRLTRHITPYWTALRKDAVSVWTGLNQDATTVLSKLQSDLDSIIGRLSTHLKPYWDGLQVQAKGAFEALRHGVGSELDQVTNDILKWGGAAHQDLLPAWIQFKEDAHSAWRQLKVQSIDDFKDIKSGIHKGIIEIVTDSQSLWRGISTGSLFITIGTDAGNSLKRGWKDVTRDAPQWGTDIVNGIVRGLEGIANYDITSWINWGHDASGVAKNAAKLAGQLILAIGGAFTSATRTIVGWGSTIVSKIGSGVTGAYKTAAKWGVDILSSIGSGFTSAWSKIGQWVTSLVSQIGSDITGAYKSIVNFGSDIISDIVSGLSNGLKDVTSFFTNLPSNLEKDLMSSGHSIADKHAEGFKGWWKSQPNIAKIGDVIILGLIAAVLAVPAAILAATITVATAIINGIISGIQLAWHFLDTEFHNWGPKIVAFFDGAGSWLVGAGQAILNGLVSGIESVASKPADAVKKVLSNISKLLPHSPAEEGPFSGRGWTLYSGMAISEALAQGIKANSGKAVSAMSGMMSDVAGVSSIGTTGANNTSSATASTIVSSLSSGAGAPTQSAQPIHVSINPSGIIARSRSELRDITKDMLSTVDEELRARRLPTILPSNTVGRSTAA